MLRQIFKHHRILSQLNNYVVCHSRSMTAVNSVDKDLFKNIKNSRVFTESDGYVWNSPFERISLPDMTIDQYVWKNVAKWKNHVAIVCGVTGRKYTYGKLRDHCAALAISLREKFGLKQDEVVAICLPNVPGKETKYFFTENSHYLLDFFFFRICHSTTGLMGSWFGGDYSESSLYIR